MRPKIFANNKHASYIATILYTFCNYHLYDVYLRDSFGEYLALTFIPLVVLSIYKVFEKKDNNWILLGVNFSFFVVFTFIELLYDLRSFLYLYSLLLCKKL